MNFFTGQRSFVISRFSQGRIGLEAGTRTASVAYFFHFSKTQITPVIITKHAFKAVRAGIFFLPFNCFIRDVYHARKTFD